MAMITALLHTRGNGTLPLQSVAMLNPLPSFRSHVTLVLCTILHAFTHAYGAMLIPLYFSMKMDLHLRGLWMASLVVTVYGVFYFLGSYFAGMLADRFDRKLLLGIGLLGNAAAIAGMGLTRRYEWILACGVAAGIFGTLFHPAANALAPSHYPRSPGMAIGLLGIGSGLGFFCGPQIAGWREHSAAWHWGAIAQWQKPCVELGAIGFIFGIIFLILGADPGSRHRRRQPTPLDPRLQAGIIRLALILMFRDFAGVATLSLAAIYVEHVFGRNAQQAGLMVGLMMLPSVIINPLCVFLSPGHRRLPALAIVLIIGALVVVTTPLWPVAMVVPVLCIFQTMQLSSYAISDAAMFERVNEAVRGRVAGLFLLIAGTFSALGPWVMGAWTDLLGERAQHQQAYFGPFGLVAAFMLLAAFSPKLIARLGPAGTPPTLAEEISPATMEAVM